MSGKALFIVVSLPSGHDLEERWSALADQRRKLGSVLRSTSWRRSTEVTHTPAGWHWHDNIVVTGDDDQLERARPPHEDGPAG